MTESYTKETFVKAPSVYDWIKGLEKAVNLGLLSKEDMEKAIEQKYDTPTRR